MTGTWSLLSSLAFRYPPKTLPQAELPYFIIAPFLGFSDYSLWFVRFPYVLMSVLIVVVMYLIGRKLFGERVGGVVALLTAINPWMIVMGRTTYEMTPAILFFMLCLYSLLSARGKWLLHVIPLSMLAFYSYIGTKIILLPFLLIVCLYAIFVQKRKQDLRYFLIILASLSLFVLFYLSMLHTSSSVSRLNEIVTPNNPEFATRVNALRHQSVSSPLTPFFVNKYSLFGETLITKFFLDLSPSFLFLSGDSFFGLWRQGLFYMVDFFFLLLGIVLLGRRQWQTLVFLVSLVCLSVLPDIIHSARLETFSPHLSLLIPLFLLLIGYAVTEGAALIRNHRIKLLAITVLCGIYLMLLVRFSSFI